MKPSLHHSFDIQLAAKYGVEEAILLHHFMHWIDINERAGRNQKDGKTWTYQTRKSIAEHFPYWTEDKVRRLTDKLVAQKILIKGNFNKMKFDHTIWYTINWDLANLPNRIGTVAKSSDENVKSSDESAKPIPDTKPTDTIPKEPSNEGSSPKRKTHRGRSNGDFFFSKKDSDWIGITPKDIDDWKKGYPGVDVEVELLQMVQWLIANPSQANKIKWRAFVTRWLKRGLNDRLNREARSAAFKMSPGGGVDRRTKNIDGTPMDAPHLEGLF